MPKRKMPKSVQRKPGRTQESNQFETAKELQPYPESRTSWETSEPLGETESNQKAAQQARKRQSQRQSKPNEHS
ncbi:MAG: hypothetical protein ACOX4G_13330 [Limnochordia bacterium]|jgi:hypothetical protein